MSSLLFIVSIIVCFILNDLNRAQNITDLVDVFGAQLESLMCDGGLNIGGDKCSNGNYGLQEFISSFEDYFDSDTTDVSALTQSIIARVDQQLNERALFLRNLSSVIQSECLHRMDDHQDDESLTAFSSLYFAGNDNKDASLPSDMASSSVYGNIISLSSSTFRIPNGVDAENENIQRDAQISQLLEATMLELHDTYCVDADGNEEYCSMYFGTINGVFTMYPGVQNPISDDGSYSDFDPRFRPWYVSAATGSKDVVILLDISNSMRDNNRITLAKEAVISVLNTLGSSSFVNIVAFSDTLTLSCFERNLVAATARNVAELIDFVTDLQPAGFTNFTNAFDAAFDILESAQNCHTAILFLTDGIADDVSALIKARNTVDIKAVILSFTLGNDTESAIPLKVAQMTNGIYTHIDDDDENLISAMSSYYLYYAFDVQSNDEHIILTSPYLDFDTEAIIITMSLPVYLNDSYFMGVLGVDIPLSFLSEAIGDITIGRKSYSFLMNEESELLLHPLIPDADQLFDSDQEYSAIFVHDVEPEEFSSVILSSMIQRQEGAKRIEAAVKQAAGNVIYNGYIHETAELLYIYSGVGPSSLSIAIVIYSESNVAAPYAPAFGMIDSPNDDCNTTHFYKCLAPFNIFHRFDLMLECDSEWMDEAQIYNGSDPDHYNAFYEGSLYSTAYPIYFLQAGLWEQQSDALNIDPTCNSLTQLHTLTNRGGVFDVDSLPFGGFREEISHNILNSIYTLSSVHEFWKPSFLANDSLFVSMWFGHYQGLHISYPGKRFSNTYNNLIRPWYQRAISYPNLMVFTTPYKHATTEKLVIGGSAVINAPNSEYAFGVAGFSYEYAAFVSYWQSSMGAVCDLSNKQHCFLIDSSGFCLYYQGMENDADDDDISRKFIGDLEPTLMQSLLERGFFVNDTNVNFQDDSIDITYIVDERAYGSNFASQATSFAYNSGRYTVHAISKTNVFVIHIDGYHRTNIYPNECPEHDECLRVLTPGCLLETYSATDCVSATIDVCIEPDSTASAYDTNEQCSTLSELSICALKNEQESDMCASSFIKSNCYYDEQPTDPSLGWVRILVIALSSIVLIVVIALICIVAIKTRKKDERINANDPDSEPDSDPNSELEGKPSAPILFYE